MSVQSRIYLDNAATSWPKPECVYEAVDRYLREIGAPGSRAGYSHAVESNRILQQARQGAARIIGTSQPRQVVFTGNCTDSLNLAILGCLSEGDHVVTTVCEHNSVLRPLRALTDDGQISVSYIQCDSQGFVSPDEVQQAIKPSTKLVAVLHGSNVTGSLQPIRRIAEITREAECLLLVDAAQTLGHVPLDVEADRIDLLAASGHKGLLGPLGTGLLYIRPGVEQQIRPLRYGGTGSASESDQQPNTMPDKYEAGNHNLPGLAGLAAAVEFVESRGVAEIEADQKQLVNQLLNGLQTISGLKLYGPKTTENRTSVVSFTLEGYDPQELAAALDVTGGVQTRAGLHCAPRMHQALGTLESGGTVRLSPGWSTTSTEIDQTLELLSELASVNH